VIPGIGKEQVLNAISIVNPHCSANLLSMVDPGSAAGYTQSCTQHTDVKKPSFI
jgi:hypothetical protein